MTGVVLTCFMLELTIGASKGQAGTSAALHASSYMQGLYAHCDGVVMASLCQDCAFLQLCERQVHRHS